MAAYRKNVGIVVFNRNLKVLMCARADKPDYQWQFPQGGIDAGEDVLTAACRELREETGIVSIEPVARLPESLRYDYPPQIFEKMQRRGSPYVGQEQFWTLFYFYGGDDEIDFCTNPEEIEFKAYEWVDPEEAPQRIVAFKKAVYRQMIDAFKPYIRPRNGKPATCRQPAEKQPDGMLVYQREKE